MSKARDIARAGTALANVDATELGYLDGVTSSVQTQLDAKAIPANVVNNSLVDAKGDILTATADNTPARQAVGANGYTLVADSSTSTGLAYAGTTQTNPVINSAFQIWQRGTSISFAGSTAASSATYTADRWQTATGTNQGVTVSRQATGDTTNLPNIQYCARYQRNSGWTGTGNLEIYQNFESINAIPYAGKSITISFYARKGANYSASSDYLYLKLWSGTGTDQNIFGTYTGSSSLINTPKVLTTTWQRFSETVTVGTTATELSLGFLFAPTGTAGANDYYEVTGVQIDLGSTALPFRTYAGTIQGELAACQRYYYRASGGNNANYGTAIGYSSTIAYLQVNLPETMRVTPTSIDYANIQLWDTTNTVTPTNMTINAANSQTTLGLMEVSASSGITQYRPYFLRGSGSGTYLGFSAEL